MKSVIASLVAVAGMSVAANAVVNTQVSWQTSADGSIWFAGTRDYAPGSTVQVRALVTYTGTATPLGLASFVFQPTVSNATATDAIAPFINGGVGSNTSSPLGVIQPSDTANFGRVSPWGRSATASSSAIRGFFHTNPNNDGINYLRIAQAQVTSWIGGVGNTTGGSGVNIAQLANVGRTTSDPAFNPSIANVYVFKFGVSLDAANTTDRTLTVDSPLAGFGNRNTTTGDREVYWWGDMNEASGSIRGTANVATVGIHVVPTPASLALLGLGGLAIGRRRR
jgi:uncharacterized protein (TIGR03382 family)